MGYHQENKMSSKKLAPILIQIILIGLIGTCAASNYLRIDNYKLGIGPEAPILSPLNTVKEPIVFVPGDGGSQLEAKLNKTTRVHYICDLQTDWYDIWLNLHLLTPMVIDCLYDNMKLHYNRTTRKTSNTEGVQIRPYKFGSVEGVAYLDRYRLPKTDYFETIISTLEKNHGLIRDYDMKGAPFDFRKAPNELDQFFEDLSDLIEQQYILSDFKPVTLICHSMGCLNSVLLLNRKTDIWKDIHIKRLISLGAPWAGSFKAIDAMLFGDNLGIPLLDGDKLRTLQSSFPSLMYLFPQTSVFGHNRTLIQSSDKNYTIATFEEFLQKAQLIDELDMWHDVKPIAESLKAPNVEIWCLYGSVGDQSTPNQTVVTSKIEPPVKNWKYNNIYGDGDGTVNLESLKACENFRKDQQKPVFLREFVGLDHIDILRSSPPANYISTEILKNDKR